MNKYLGWLVAILIYLVSTTICWNYHHNAYSKGGRWEHTEPNGIAVFMTFMPVINTVGCLVIGLQAIPDWNTTYIFQVKK